MRWIVGLAFVLVAATAAAEPFRVALFNTELQRRGPGLFLRDIVAAEDADIAEAAARIARAAPDAVVLAGIDHDHGLRALRAFRDRVAAAGHDLPHIAAPRPNTGLPTALDIDGDGRRGGPRDAQGFGYFAGQGAMAVLSRHPVAVERNLSDILWRDLPGALLTQDDPGHEIQRLSSTAHWIARIDPPGAPPIRLLAFHATPPVFDGPEDRNGRRNHDEAALWTAVLDGAFGPPPEARFVLLGDANLDPVDGDGRPTALRRLLQDPRLQDPAPTSADAAAAALAEGGANTRHAGDPARDTANWDDTQDGPGNLRVDYVLPSADWTVREAGVLWPAAAPDAATDGARISRHGLVWVDLLGEG